MRLKEELYYGVENLVQIGEEIFTPLILLLKFTSGILTPNNGQMQQTIFLEMVQEKSLLDLFQLLVIIIHLAEEELFFGEMMEEFSFTIQQHSNGVTKPRRQ